MGSGDSFNDMLDGWLDSYLTFLGVSNPIWTIVTLFVTPIFIFAAGLLIVDMKRAAGVSVKKKVVRGKHRRVRTSVSVEHTIRDTTTSFYLTPSRP